MSENQQSASLELVLEHARKHAAMDALRHNFEAKMRGNYHDFRLDYRTLHDEVIIPTLTHYIHQRDVAAQYFEECVKHLMENPHVTFSVMADMQSKLQQIKTNRY